jgi:hypothetical protein
MDPMPSGAAAHQGDESADAAAVGAGLGPERADVGGIAAMSPAGAAAALAALGRARAGAEPAMHAAAAVRHGRLAAGFAAAGAGTTARCGQEVAGPGAVLEPAAPVGRQAGEGDACGSGHCRLDLYLWG